MLGQMRMLTWGNEIEARLRTAKARCWDIIPRRKIRSRFQTMVQMTPKQKKIFAA